MLLMSDSKTELQLKFCYTGLTDGGHSYLENFHHYLRLIMIKWHLTTLLIIIDRGINALFRIKRQFLNR